METEKRKRNNLLSEFGLKPYMVWSSPAPVIYDTSKFISYVSSEYKNSQRKEVDEVYRMFEIILLHKKTGLRIGYTTTESDNGERVEYKLNIIFIITETNEREDVLSIDFDKEVFLVKNKNKTLPFQNVSKLID
jgi:hypothetical protein